MPRQANDIKDVDIVGHDQNQHDFHRQLRHRACTTGFVIRLVGNRLHRRIRDTSSETDLFDLMHPARPYWQYSGLAVAFRHPSAARPFLEAVRRGLPTREVVFYQERERNGSI